MPATRVPQRLHIERQLIAVWWNQILPNERSIREGGSGPRAVRAQEFGGSGQLRPAPGETLRYLAARCGRLQREGLRRRVHARPLSGNGDVTRWSLSLFRIKRGTPLPH